MLMLEPLSNMVKYILDTFASRLVNTYTVTTKHVVYTLVFSLAVVSGPTTVDVDCQGEVAPPESSSGRELLHSA